MGEEGINHCSLPPFVDYDGGASGDRSNFLDSGGILGLLDRPKLVGQLVAGECRLPAAGKRETANPQQFPRRRLVPALAHWW